MRRLIVLTIALMFICMPLLAQETGTASSGSGAEATGGCGKVMMGSMGEPEEEGAVEGAEGADAAAEGDLYYDDGAAAEGGGGEELQADCGAPDAEEFFVCTEAGVSYNCYCCDAADQQIPYVETCEPCCMAIE
jgi:hypothetical protein